MAEKNSTLRELTVRVVSLEETLGLRQKRTRIEWMKSNWLGFAGLFVGLLAIVIGYFSWWQPQWKAADATALSQTINKQVQQEFRDKNFSQVIEDVNRTKGQMEGIYGLLNFVVKKEAKEAAQLPPKQFQSILPQVGAILSTAKTVNANVDVQASTELQTKIRQSNREDVGFWNAASSMVSYLSPTDKRVLPDCLAKPPVNKIIDAARRNGVVTAHKEPALYENCEINLASPIPYDVAKTIQVLSKYEVELRHCRVIYRGGDIALLAYADRLLFTESVFELETPTTPPAQGRRLVETLLASSNLNAVEIAG
jgi:hypothetical protein